MNGTSGRSPALGRPHADEVSRYKLEAGASGDLVILIARVRGRAESKLGKPVRVISAYEAGWDGFWLHRLLGQHDIISYVIDPASIQVDRRARRVKTDAVGSAALFRSVSRGYV